METENGILCQDILEEILSRLPQKSLCRCKCVSKKWCSLISNIRGPGPRFLWQSINPDGSLQVTFHSVDREGGIVPDRSLDFTFQETSTALFAFGPYVADSCNGLLLIRYGWISFATIPGLSYVYHVYNASTKKWVTLPCLCVGSSETQVGLAFDGCNYKVICLFVEHMANPSSYHFMIFSSETGEWTEKQEPISPPNSVCHGGSCIGESPTACFFRGAMHWILFKWLLVYHLDENYSKLIELPKHQEPPKSVCPVVNECLLESEENLHYCCVDYYRIYIWVLQGDYEWQLKHTATWKTIESENPGIIPQGLRLAGKYSLYMFWPRALNFSPFVLNGELGGVLYLSDGKAIVSYHLANGKLQKAYASPVEQRDSSRTCIIYPFSHNRVGKP